MTSTAWLRASLLAMGVLGTAGALAQTANQSSQGANPSSLQEIVVTAQKREERLQDVPIQIDVFTPQTIAALQIKNTQDFITYVPNMTMGQEDTYRNSNVVIRGLTQITNADTPMAVIVDGVPQTDQKQFNMRLYDISQIEVLKGPQGSLYGRDAEGGVVIINTNPPTNNFGGFADVSYGSGETVTAMSAISGPIIPDKVTFRLAADYLSSAGQIYNGYQHNDADSVDYDESVRARINIAFTDTITADLRAQYGDYQAKPNIWSAVLSRNPNDFVDPINSYPNRSRGDDSDFTAKFDDHFSFATLTAITGYTAISENSYSSLDMQNPVNNPGGFDELGFQLAVYQPFYSRIVTQELRLVSNSDQRLRWIVGADYRHTYKTLENRIFIDEYSDYAEAFNPALLVQNPSLIDHNNADGVYGQLDYDLTSKVILSAGVRYDDDRRQQTDVGTPLAPHAAFSATQPKVTATYKFTADQLAYATIGTGFRSGGFNNPGAPIPVYSAEKLRNFEVGFKTSWLDRRLSVNGALFYSPVSNYQFFFVDLTTASQVVGNINKVDIYGAELETRFNASDNFSLFLNAGKIRPDIRQITEFPGNTGNYTPQSVTDSEVLGAEYRHTLSGDINGVARLDVDHYGKTYWEVDNIDVQNPKTYLNASYSVERAAWSFTLWGKNLTNERAYEYYFPGKWSSLYIDVGRLNEPLSCGIEARVKF
jgi:iron complex outermembrane recepter protein